MSSEIIDILSGAIGLTLTLIIFSYLLGDTPLFRIAVYIFIGVASGYAATVVMHYVLLPRLSNLVQTNEVMDFTFGVIPFVFGVSLTAKFFPRTAWIGNFAMALLVGVGAAAAIGGALIGTVIPQFQAAIGAFDRGALGGGLQQFLSGLLQGSITLVGTITTLAAFHFSAGRTPDGTPKRNTLIEGIAFFGRIFIAITLGVLFAGVYMAALTAMIERLSSIINFVRQLIGT